MYVVAMYVVSGQQGKSISIFTDAVHIIIISSLPVGMLNKLEFLASRVIAIVLLL